MIHRSIRGGEMHARELLIIELGRLAGEFGPTAEVRALIVLAEVIRWLRQHGHGDITLSAQNHLFGKKFRSNTVISVEGITS